MVELLIDAEFRRLIPPLSAEERQQLEENVLRDGCRDPLVVWRNGRDILLDGHNRYEICTRHSIAFQVQSVQVESRERAKLWIEENQLGRRNLTDDQRAMVAEAVRERRSKLQMAEQRAAAIGKRWHPEKYGSIKASDPKPKRDTRAEVARENKVSERKLIYARELRREAPELAAQVHLGERTLMDAMRQKRQAGRRAAVTDIATRKAKQLEGRFDVIVVDPPWPAARVGFADLRLDSNAPLPYPAMTVETIQILVGEKLDRHACASCHIFLWTTQRFLPVAFRLLDAWKLDYSFTMVWHKPAGPKPLDLPTFNSEFCLYARKGSPRFLDTKGFFTCFEAPRGAHSEKPEQFYETLRRVTGGRRLDMFNRRMIEGFERWGKEAPGRGRSGQGQWFRNW
jgi:N6-adenosine-specific RNA methylase IME4